VTLFASMRVLYGGLLLVLWLGGAAYGALDARRRFFHRSPACFWTGVAALVPIVGVGLYLLFRPPLTRAERRARRYRLLYLESLAAQPGRSPLLQDPRPAEHPEQPSWELPPVPVEVTAA
jgi:hypothetical protein